MYVKKDSNGNVTDVIINESKYGKARLGKAKMGGRTPVKQMSDPWIQGNIDKMKISSDPEVRKAGRFLDNYHKQGNDATKMMNRTKADGKTVWTVLGIF